MLKYSPHSYRMEAVAGVAAGETAIYFALIGSLCVVLWKGRKET